MFKSGSFRLTRASTILALILILSGQTITLAQDDGREELDEGLALLGIIVGTEEQDAVDVIYEGGKFLLPAEETFRAINTKLRRESEGNFLDTPIGSIEIATESLREIDDATFIGEDFLIDALSTPVSFDIESYAIVLEPPWDNDEPLKTDIETASEIEPDVVPPIVGMTSVHGDLFTTYTDVSDDIGISSQLEVNGHAFGGVWRLGYAGTLEDHSLAEYAWLREVNDNIWALFGRQQVGVHPLIDVIDMTGAQIAYSNRPETFEQIDDVGGVLLDRSGGANRRFFGEGPAGGRVELAIDGVVVEEGIIGVDGSYTIESPLLGQRRSEVEIRIFEPLSKNQVETIDITVTANSFLAPKGSFNVVAGAGVEGNVLDPEESIGEVAGFARVRYAPLDDLTLEGAVSYEPENGGSLAVGAAVQLGKLGTAYAGASISGDGSNSVEALYYGEFGKTTVNARARYTESEPAEDQDRSEQLHDHYAEVAYEYSSRLRFGAIARYNIEATYVLPFATWRPRERLSFSARPNREGVYRFEARAEPFRDVTLQVFYEGDGFARVGYAFETEATGRTEASLEAIYRTEERGVGVAVGLRGERILGAPVSWVVRGERDERSMTGSLGLRHELRPGVSVYADGGIRKYRSRQDETFGSLGLSFDLGFADGKMTQAPRNSTNPRHGRLAGKVNLPEGVEMSEEELAGARVIVDGRPMGRVERDGGYWIANVPKGVRNVRLEADELPIDLVIDSEPINAKIAPGAVTPVNFQLAVEVGTAGRITGPDGKPVGGVPLQMTDAEGTVKSRAQSNQFGLFRMDGLRPGTYTLTALDIWKGASREVIIGSEYAFGSDLKVSKPSKPAPKEETVTQP